MERKGIEELFTSIFHMYTGHPQPRRPRQTGRAMHAHLMIRTSLAPGRPSHQRIGGGGISASVQAHDTPSLMIHRADARWHACHEHVDDGRGLEATSTS